MKTKVLKFQTQVCEFCIEHNCLFYAFFSISVDPLVLEITIQEMGEKLSKQEELLKEQKKLLEKALARIENLEKKGGKLQERLQATIDELKRKNQGGPVVEDNWCSLLDYEVHFQPQPQTSISSRSSSSPLPLVTQQSLHRMSVKASPATFATGTGTIHYPGTW